MMKYSFVSKYGNCTKEQAIEFVKTTEKPFKYTYGLGYRKPSTHNKPITREEALSHMGKCMVDMEEHENYVHINRYSEMDMW